MINYLLNNQNIFLPATNGETIVLALTGNSGRILYRDKINTLIGIKHPGIELGIDQFGYRWIIHHHYKNTFPTIDREDKFSLGKTIFYDKRNLFYNRDQILERGLAAWWSKVEYSWLWHNCQHFVNQIAKGENKSEAIEEISTIAMISGGILSLIGAFTGNKTLSYSGLGIMGSGLAGKALSK